MNQLPLDRKAAGLLNRVRKDIAHLRNDLTDLWDHTTRNTLPRAARELGDRASDRVAAGGAYAASRLRHSLHRHTPHRQRSSGWMTGALAVGVVAAGVYALMKGGSPAGEGRGEEESGGTPGD